MARELRVLTPMSVGLDLGKLAAVLVAAVAYASACSLPGCVHEDSEGALTVGAATGQGPGGAGGEGGADPTGGSGGAPVDPEALAKALWDEVEPDVVDACGGCHDDGGTANKPFLAPPYYDSIRSWEGILAEDPDESLLFTYPGTLNHEQELGESLAEKVHAWLEAEAVILPPSDGLVHTAPFEPLAGGALNVVYFVEVGLGPQFEGFSLSFNAAALLDPDGDVVGLELSNLTATPVGHYLLHLAHPRFVVHHENGAIEPDPGDGLGSLDQTYPGAVSTKLEPSLLVVSSWLPGDRLSLAFDAIEVLAINGGVVEPCDHLGEFEAYASPLLLESCAQDCHGGNDGEALAMMDLSGLAAGDFARACRDVRARIVAGETAAETQQSQLLLAADPAQSPAHTFKLDESAYGAFEEEVIQWISLEAP